MKRLITIICIIVAVYLSSTESVSADGNVVSESAKLKTVKIDDTFDYRVVSLKNYLKKHNSPLTSSANYFVLYADKYNLDWRFVPAISGVESTFGKRIPINSYNAYGWANGAYYFESWEDSIVIVS